MTRTSWPSWASALGREPQTSARPPVLANGATSELRKRILRAGTGDLPRTSNVATGSVYGRSRGLTVNDRTCAGGAAAPAFASTRKLHEIARRLNDSRFGVTECQR